MLTFDIRFKARSWLLTMIRSTGPNLPLPIVTHGSWYLNTSSDWVWIVASVVLGFWKVDYLMAVSKRPSFPVALRLVGTRLILTEFCLMLTSGKTTIGLAFSFTSDVFLIPYLLTIFFSDWSLFNLCWWNLSSCKLRCSWLAMAGIVLC